MIKMLNNKAFTMTELMVVVALFTVIISATYLVLATGNNTWFTASAYIDVQQELRKAKETMMKDIIEARFSSVDIPVGGTSISLQIPGVVSDGGSITWHKVEYYLAGTANRQLIKEVDDNAANLKVVANNISALNFTQDATHARLIIVSVTANERDVKRRLISSNLNFEIKVRN